MNRFFDRKTILNRELSPWESKRLGFKGTSGIFQLQESDLRLKSDIAGGIIWVPYGFFSDLASIPTWVQFAVNMDSDDQRIAFGAWFHDYLYKQKGEIAVYTDDLQSFKMVKLTRKQCDQILCDECMVDLYASSFDRGRVYAGLRLGGWTSF